MYDKKEITNNVLLSDVALRLRMYREKKGISIEEAAKAVGINSDRLFKWENDKETPSFDKVALLADINNEREIWR